MEPASECSARYAHVTPLERIIDTLHTNQDIHTHDFATARLTSIPE